MEPPGSKLCSLQVRVQYIGRREPWDQRLGRELIGSKLTLLNDKPPLETSSSLVGSENWQTLPMRIGFYELGDKRHVALANGCLGARNFPPPSQGCLKASAINPVTKTSPLQSHQDVPPAADRTRPVCAPLLELASHSTEPSPAPSPSCSTFRRLRLPANM